MVSLSLTSHQGQRGISYNTIVNAQSMVLDTLRSILKDRGVILASESDESSVSASLSSQDDRVIQDVESDEADQDNISLTLCKFKIYLYSYAYIETNKFV